MPYRTIAWLHGHLVAGAARTGPVEYVTIILMIAVLLTAMIAVPARGGLTQIPEVLVDQLEGESTGRAFSARYDEPEYG